MAVMNEEALGRALAILQDVSEQDSGGLFQETAPGSLPELPEITEAAAHASADAAQELLDQLDALDEQALPVSIQCTIRIARAGLQRQILVGRNYWLGIDPLNIGFVSTFGPTNYCLGFMLSKFAARVADCDLRHPSGGDRLLTFVSQLAEFIEQMASRSKGQAERGILVPEPQLDSVEKLLGSFRASMTNAIMTSANRETDWDKTRFLEELSSRVDDDLCAALDKYAVLFGADYRQKAPEDVGISQFDGGAEFYAELVKLHTTLDLSPEEVHEIGFTRMKSIRAQMAEIRDRVGFEGDDHEYLASHDSDAHFRAETRDGVIDVFQRYIDRLNEVYPSYFDFVSPKPYGASPLPSELEGGMTFGFYQVPEGEQPAGRYLFNGANLTQKNLVNIAALNYHELVPGHHLHFTTQRANRSVHPIHRNAFFNAFNEGWAEYSATLAGEMGMYEHPAEEFGRLVMDAFLTCRLVVDTGMNALGWSLEEARNYLRENAFMSEAEIQSETVRYSCDLPGQSLAYKLGDTEFLRLREKMRNRLGDKFDIRDFHRAALHPGGMPLRDLEWHFDMEADRIAAA